MNPTLKIRGNSEKNQRRHYPIFTMGTELRDSSFMLTQRDGVDEKIAAVHLRRFVEITLITNSARIANSADKIESNYF